MLFPLFKTLQWFPTPLRINSVIFKSLSGPACSGPCSPFQPNFMPFFPLLTTFQSQASRNGFINEGIAFRILERLNKCFQTNT